VGAYWIGETNVSDDPVAKKCADSALGVVEKLIRDHDVERLDLNLHAADGAHRNQPLNTQFFEAVNVRAIVDVRRLDSVPASVTGEKGDPFSLQRSQNECIGRITKWGLDTNFLDIGQLIHLVKSASTQNADFHFCHESSIGSKGAVLLQWLHFLVVRSPSF